MGLSVWQILIIVAVLLIIFGPSRIPSLGRSLGQAIRGFKKGLEEDDDESKKLNPSSQNLKKSSPALEEEKKH